jgi:hypothetical protein
MQQRHKNEIGCNIVKSFKSSARGGHILAAIQVESVNPGMASGWL